MIGKDTNLKKLSSKSHKQHMKLILFGLSFLRSGHEPNAFHFAHDVIETCQIAYHPYLFQRKSRTNHGTKAGWGAVGVRDEAYRNYQFRSKDEDGDLSMGSPLDLSDIFAIADCGKEDTDLIKHSLFVIFHNVGLQPAESTKLDETFIRINGRYQMMSLDYLTNGSGQVMKFIALQKVVKK